MKNIKCALVVAVFIVGIVISLLSCSQKQPTKRILFFAYYSSDTTDGTKTFELHSDGTVLFKNGVRDSKNASIEPLKFTVEMKKYTIGKIELSKIKTLIKKLEKCGDLSIQSGIYNDVFEVVIRTDTVRINRLMIGTKSKCDAIVSDVCDFFNIYEFLY